MDATKCITFMGALLLLAASLPAEACRCRITDHPQVPFCSSAAVVKAKFIKESQRGPTSASNDTEIGFDAKIFQVLKGATALQTSTFIVNYMADTSCKYFHPQDGYNTMYLVTGSNQNGNVGIMGCNFLRRWSELTPKQISGLCGAYAPGCKTCEITICDSPPCQPESGKCKLEEYAGGDSNNQKANQACIRNKRGICAWKTIR